MYKRCIRWGGISSVLIMVPALALVVAGLPDVADDPKYIGGAAATLLVMLLTLWMALVGGSRPGLAMSVLGGGGVMVFATAWIFADVPHFLLSLAGGCLFLLSVLAALAKLDSMRDDGNTSYFRR